MKGRTGLWQVVLVVKFAVELGRAACTGAGSCDADVTGSPSGRFPCGRLLADQRSASVLMRRVTKSWPASGLLGSASVLLGKGPSAECPRWSLSGEPAAGADSPGQGRHGLDPQLSAFTAQVGSQMSGQAPCRLRDAESTQLSGTGMGAAHTLCRGLVRRWHVGCALRSVSSSLSGGKAGADTCTCPVGGGGATRARTSPRRPEGASVRVASGGEVVRSVFQKGPLHAQRGEIIATWGEPRVGILVAFPENPVATSQNTLS